MRHLSTLVIIVLGVAAVTGCAWRAETVECEPEAVVSVEEPVVFAGGAQKDTIDDGRDLLRELAAPMVPAFKTRTIGELTQVSFTRVGGDDSVNASSAEDLIVFSSDRHGMDHNIYTKTPTGSVVTQKTFGPFDEIQPAFSPDGTRIAYASNKNGNYDIWVIETHENGTEIQVTFGDEDELHPTWTPDGDAIVCSSFSSRSGEWTIMLCNVQTGEVKDLGRGKFPQLSPDGTKVLFQRARNRDGYWYSIWTMNLDGTSQTEIVTSADWAAINPCWSPDGQFIAFATVYKSPMAKIEDRIWRADDIFVVRINGRELLQITADPQPAWSPCWSKRDGRLYFVSERNGFRNIWSIKPPVLSVASTADAAESTATE